MLLPFLAATGPDEPATPPTPREPEITPPSEPPTEPDRVAPTPPDPDPLPPGVPFREPEPEPDLPEGPGVSDPDLAPGAPLAPPEYAPERRPLPDDRMDDGDGDDGDVPYDTASLPPDHPAYDRIQSRPAKAPSQRSRLGGVITAVALVAAGLLVTYALVRPEATPANVQDLLTLAAEHAGAVTLDVTTSDLDEAQQFIVGEFGWPIRVPVLPDARLAGDPPVDVRRVDDRYLVLWRRRATIYTAVTPDDPGPLVEYLKRH